MESTSTISHAINNYYDKMLLERAMPNLVHDRYGQVRDIPANNTNVIKFRKYGALALATTPLDEGITPVSTSLSITDITATVRQYGAYVTLTDFLQFTTLDPVLMETAAVLGQQAGETLDVIVRDILAAGSNVFRVADRATRELVQSGDVMTTTVLDKVIRFLHNQNAKKITQMVSANPGQGTVPVDACFVGIVHPNVLYTLQGLTGFNPVEKYADKSNLMPGEVGSYKEIRFVQSTYAKVFEDAGVGSAVDVYATLIMGRDAYGTSRIAGKALQNIVKPLGAGEDALNQRSTSGWKATKTAVILQQLWLARVESAAAA